MQTLISAITTRLVQLDLGTDSITDSDFGLSTHMSLMWAILRAASASDLAYITGFQMPVHGGAATPGGNTGVLTTFNGSPSPWLAGGANGSVALSLTNAQIPVGWTPNYGRAIAGWGSRVDGIADPTLEFTTALQYRTQIRSLLACGLAADIFASQPVTFSLNMVAGLPSSGPSREPDGATLPILELAFEADADGDLTYTQSSASRVEIRSATAPSARHRCSVTVSGVAPANGRVGAIVRLAAANTPTNRARFTSYGFVVAKPSPTGLIFTSGSEGGSSLSMLVPALTGDNASSRNVDFSVRSVSGLQNLVPTLWVGQNATSVDDRAPSFFARNVASYFTQAIAAGSLAGLFVCAPTADASLRRCQLAALSLLAETPLGRRVFVWDAHAAVGDPTALVVAGTGHYTDVGAATLGSAFWDDLKSGAISTF